VAVEAQLPGDFAASLERAIANEGGGLGGGESLDSVGDDNEPGRVDLKPGESAQGELVLDHAIAGLGPGAKREPAPEFDPGADEASSKRLPDPGAAPVQHSDAKVQLPRKPGPHGWESRRLTLLSVFLPLLLIVLAFAHLGPEAGGLDVFAGLAPRPGEEPDGVGEPFVEGEYSIPDFGSGAPETDLPIVRKKCEYGSVGIDGDICIDQGEFPGLGQMPMTRINYADAQAQCEAKGARLCRAEEWQLGCGGPKGQRYPYGDFFKAHCNTAGGDNEIVRVRATGASGKCRSPRGTYDQSGNVGEWVEGGYVMGGDVRTPGQGAMCKARGKPPKGFKGEFVGFRCCMDRF
jgi:hypothetical protein